MTDSTAPFLTPEDSEESLLLETYLELLENGEQLDRQAWEENHPQLAGLFSCLEQLHRHTGSSLIPNDPLEREFDDFILLGEIGRGGMGVVHRAWQKSLRRVVAIKHIHAPAALIHPDDLRRFQREAEAAARLRHPRIVHVFGAGKVAGQPYLAMEYIAGESLANRLRREKFDWREGVELLRKIALTVEYLHQQGVLHRDLKPSNILLDEREEPYVADFGLVKWLGDPRELTLSGTAAGTPLYMPPEQARGDNTQGPRGDIYSLGAILYEILTSQPPFPSETPWEALLQVLEKEPVDPRTLNPQIPADLAAVCLKCLEKNPTARYASAGELAKDLQRVLNGESVSAGPPSLWQKIRRWSRRHPALSSRLGAFLLFYLVESGSYWVYGLYERSFHNQVTAVCICWIVACWVFEGMTKRQVLRRWVPWFWSGIDAGCLTGLLLIADGPGSPLIVAWPLLIVMSGLWFRPKVVWGVTGLGILSYLTLLADMYLRRGWILQNYNLSVNHFLYFSICFLITGAVVAHQVKRTLALSHLPEHFGE